MRIVITEKLYNELADRYCIEKSNHNKRVKANLVKKIVQIKKKNGGVYEGYRWINPDDELKNQTNAINNLSDSQKDIIHKYISILGLIPKRDIQNLNEQAKIGIMNSYRKRSKQAEILLKQIQTFIPKLQNETQSKYLQKLKIIEKNNQNNSSKNIWRSLGKVDSRIVNMAKTLNINLTDYEHSITDSFKNHAVDKHGSFDKERSQKQIPITQNDLNDNNIKNIVTNPDFIIMGTKTQDNKQNSIIYVKNIDTACCLVEEILTPDKKRLLAKTFWKKDHKLNNKIDTLNDLKKTGKYDISQCSIKTLKELT